jgi:antirestriction protein ArdC
MNTSRTQSDVYSRVTQQIVAQLEQGIRPWIRPWKSGHAAVPLCRPLRHNGMPYRGVNVLLLWGEAFEKAYTSPIWMTYRQAQELGGHVRKGEHGTFVVYADQYVKTEGDEASGEAIERRIAFMKAYVVFNVEQIAELPAHFYPTTEAMPAPAPVPRIEAAEAFFAGTGARILHGGDRAFYSPTRDFIQMPPRERFRDAPAYCTTLAHELVHWTSHPMRIHRELGKRFGDDAYAAEELIAEMGAAFLSADLGITPEVLDDHAAYLALWLNVLKDDSRAIFTAASQAQRAVDYLHQLQDAAKVQVAA